MGRAAQAACVALTALGLGAYLLLRAQRARRPTRAAVCVLRGAATGMLRFAEFAPPAGGLCGYTRISGLVRGLRPGAHGLAVHEYGDVSDGAGCAGRCGAHFNPAGCAHGAPGDPVRHVGDLGNIIAGRDGDGEVLVYDVSMALSGRNSVIGRALVVYALPDDCGRGDNSEPWPAVVQGKSSKTTGNAGDRIACGVIGWADA